jgi:hypothetical protein
MTDQTFLDGVLKLCQHVEALAPGSRTGICMANEDGSRLKQAFFPNLPQTFQQAIRDISQLPPYFGSCNAAMHDREVITTHDMKHETRFDERFVAHCLAHSIVALQSRPVYGAEGKPLGTFVMGFSEPRAVTDFDITLMDFAADAASELLREARARGAAS